MNSLRSGMSPTALVAVTAWMSDRAWAQNTSNTPAAPPATTSTGDGGGTAIAAVVVVVGLLVVIGLAVKLFDLKRKRESEAVQLQAQLSDALLREPSLAGLPLTPTVHVPMWRGTPATIELTGQVPRPEAKDIALRLVRDEATRIRPDIEIVDRLSIAPAAAHAA